MTAIVLAGGKKSLINEFYPEVPTALIPVADQPFLFWLTQWIKSQGFLQIVYSAGMYVDKVSAWVNEQATHDADILFDVLGEIRPLGTGGATLMAVKRFPSDIFLVVNGDSLLFTQLENSIQLLKQSSDLDGMIVATHLNNAGRFGTLILDDQHHLIEFKEKQPGKGVVNAGIYLLKQSLFESLEAEKGLSLESDCFPLWLQAGKKFKVIVTEEPFIEISTPESLTKARDLILPLCPMLEGVVIE